MLLRFLAPLDVFWLLRGPCRRNGMCSTLAGMLLLASIDTFLPRYSLTVQSPSPLHPHLQYSIQSTSQSIPTVTNNMGKRANRDPNAPKRNMSAYLLYQNAMRDEFKARNPDMSFGQVRYYCRRTEERLEYCPTNVSTVKTHKFISVSFLHPRLLRL